MKNYIHDAFELFLDEHKDFTEEHKDLPESPHKPRYSYINLSAEEEFYVFCLLRELNDKQLYFLYALMSQAATAMLAERKDTNE